MRKIFGGAMLFSGLGAAILGGALAWNSTEISQIETVEVGAVDFEFTYVQRDNAILGPNDGSFNHVGHGWVWNQGNLNLLWHSGGVEIIDVNVVNGEVLDGALCSTFNFGGRVVPLATFPLQTGGIPPTAGPSGNYDDPATAHVRVDMAVAAGAPDACQGGTVDYVVYVTLQSTNGLPPPPVVEPPVDEDP